jgi:hypothetical protein
MIAILLIGGAALLLAIVAGALIAPTAGDSATAPYDGPRHARLPSPLLN